MKYHYYELTNIFLGECLGLLGISPTSPAASIFMKNGTSSTPTTSTSSSSSSPTNGAGNSINMNGNGVLSSFIAVFVTVILSVSTMI